MFCFFENSVGIEIALSGADNFFPISCANVCDSNEKRLNQRCIFFSKWEKASLEAV